MYICICHGITEKQLQKIALTGAQVGEILRQLNVGNDCGTCLPSAVESYLKYRTSPPKKNT